MSIKGFQLDVSITELNDVDTTGSPAIATGDALIYNNATGNFEQQPTPIFAGIGALPDVTITGSPADVGEKEILSYDNTTEQWVNRKIPDAGLLACSTGLMDGGNLLFGTGSPTTTTFTVTAGTGVVVDNYTDPNNPTYTTVSWSQFTDQPITSLAVADRTFVAINSAGALLQQTVEFTPDEHRDVIHIGTIGHANRINVVAVRTNPHAAFDVNVRLGDLAEAIGAFNITGNIYSANGASFNIDKTAGTSYRLGTNFHTGSPPGKKSPDITNDALETALSFNYSYRGVGTDYVLGTTTTTIDAENYDGAAGSPAGTETMPVNDWQVQIIKHFPGGPGTRIEYGQTTYGTAAAAISAIPDINHVHNPAFAEGIVRGYLVIQQGELATLATAQFIEAGRFGASGAAGSTGGSVFSSAFESGELGIAASTEYSASHGLGVRPSGMQAFVRCGSPPELGYFVGDEAEFSNGIAGSPPTTTYKGLYADTTNIYWHTGTSLVVTNRNNGAPANINLSLWKIILRAYA